MFFISCDKGSINFFLGSLLLKVKIFLYFSVNSYKVDFDGDVCYWFESRKVLEKERINLSNFEFFEKLLKVFFREDF